MNLQGPKFTLIAISLLFLTPLLLAIMMRTSWWDFEPSAFANRGNLVEPPIEMSGDWLQPQAGKDMTAGKQQPDWTMLYTFDENCGRPCLEDIASLRQIHLASGKDRQRVGILLVSPQEVTEVLLNSLQAVYDQLDIMIDADGELFSAIQSIGADGVFLLDPSDLIILHYPPGFAPGDINQDLDRLLTWSATK